MTPPRHHGSTATAAKAATAAGVFVLGVAVAAAALPSMLAFNLPPSPTFLNQAVALCLWGWFATAVAAQSGNFNAGALLRSVACPLMALLLLAVLAVASGTWGALPSALCLSAVGLLFAASVLMCSGAHAARGSHAQALFQAFCWAWLVAGLLNVAIAAVQVLAPQWADGDWIARSGSPGRAVGNLRQPNHLASLLVWSAAAVVPLAATGALARRWAWCAMAALVTGLVMTASRTGMLGVLMLLAWGLLSPALGRPQRRLLASTPLWYGLAWAALAAWARLGAHTFGAEERLAEVDLSASRFGIWSNTLELIAQQPWLGVGFGEFNLAWTLTPFPGRPVALFDHTHNLLLQWAVELGLPATLVLCALLLTALWQAWQRAAKAQGVARVQQNTAFMMVLMAAVHSQLEYPLWYAYFLLPMAWMLGFALGSTAGNNSQPTPTHPARGATATWIVAAAVALVLGSGLAFVDYMRVARIFSAQGELASLEQRIDQGRRSVLFAHHADYAAATHGEPVPNLDAAFASATHYLLDARLMMAWAKHLQARGEVERARHVAQRLKEFRNPAADAFFAPCAEAGSQARGWLACTPPARPVHWRELLEK